MAAEPQPAHINLPEQIVRQLPNGFMEGGISQGGIYTDYYNTFGGLPFLASIITDKNTAEERRKGALNLIKTQLQQVQTYTQYITQRAEIFNEKATKRNRPCVNVNAMIALLVTGVPITHRLDEIAKKVKALAEGEEFENHFDHVFELFDEAYQLRLGEHESKKHPEEHQVS